MLSQWERLDCNPRSTMPDPAPRSSPDGPVDIDVVEGLFADYISDPASVPAQWRACFDALPADPDAVQAALAQVARAGPDGWSAAGPPAAASGQARPDEDAVSGAAGIQHCVNKLVRAYRVQGHMAAGIDPLELVPRTSPDLDPAYYGLQTRDLDRKISPKTLSGCALDTPRTVIERLRETYTRSIGVQFMHIDDLGIREWLQQRMEPTGNHVALTLARQLRILTKLTGATIFEDFIQKKFVGAKSFSLEGCETLIPLLDLLIERASVQNVNDIVIGMAHRGRLNVLANVVGKNAQEISASSPTWITCTTKDGETSSTISATAVNGRVPRARPCGCPCVSIRATSSTSIPSPWAACAPGRTARTTSGDAADSASCCTATPRSRAKASCRKRST